MIAQCAVVMTLLLSAADDQPAMAEPELGGGAPAWSAENEDAALAKVRALVEADKVQEAYEIADIYRELARYAPATLQYPKLWYRAGGHLYDAKQYAKYPPTNIHRLRRRARAAEALGLFDLAIDVYVTAIEAEDDFDKCFSDIQGAAICAIRKRDYEQAARFHDQMKQLNSPWVRELAARRALQLREFAKNPDQVDARIKFASECLTVAPPAGGRYYEDAITLLRETLQVNEAIDAEKRKAIYTYIFQYYRKTEDVSAARDWADRIIADFPDDRPFQGALLVRVGSNHYHNKDFDKALACFREVVDRYPDTAARDDAQYGIGAALMELRDYRRALPELQTILEATLHNDAPTAEGMARVSVKMPLNILFPTRGYKHAASKRVSLCYESLKDYQRALEYLREALFRYQPVVPCLTCSDTLRNPESALGRLALLEALAALSEPDDQMIVQAVRPFFLQGNQHSRRILVELGGASVPLLVEALSDDNATICRAAAELLADLGPEAKEAIPALCQSLKSEDYVVQRTAARTLKNLQPEAKDCLPTVLDGLSSKDHIVFGAFRATLEELDCGPEEVPLLIERLEEAQHSTEAIALGAMAIISKLKEIGPGAKEAIPVLKRLVRDNPGNLHDSARRALLAIEAER